MRKIIRCTLNTRGTSGTASFLRAATVVAAISGTLVGGHALSQPVAKPGAHTIAIVIPREEQNIERGFRDYLVKRLLPVRFETIRYSGQTSDASALIEEVRALKPDLIYSWATSTTLALAGRADSPPSAGYIHDIPIVFTEVTDPVDSGLLSQLDPPLRNVTGVSHVAPLTVQLNAMRSYRPFKRLGYLVNPAETNTQGIATGLRALAKEMKFELLEESIPVDANGAPNPQALPELINRLAKRQADLLYIGPSTFLAFTHRDLVTSAAMKVRLPTFCATESIVRQSRCMFGLFANGSNIGRFAAYKANQILSDQVPVAQIPAQALQRFSLLINMPVAKTLELYPPLSLLNVAEVIE